MATVDAKGQSLFEKNSSHRTFPIINVFDPPSSDGITNSPSVGIKTNTINGAWKTNLSVRPEQDWKDLKGRAIVDE